MESDPHSGRTIRHRFGRVDPGLGPVGTGEPGRAEHKGALHAPRDSPARMKSKTRKAVLEPLSMMRFSWAARARKIKLLRKDRKPALTAKAQAT